MKHLILATVAFLTNQFVNNTWFEKHYHAAVLVMIDKCSKSHLNLRLSTFPNILETY